MKNLICICLFVLLSQVLIAQKDVEGRILDKKNMSLIGATVVLMDNIDSTMVAFALTNDSGKFRLESVEYGEYYAQINYVGYTTKNVPISIAKEDSNISFGDIILEESSEILNEVTIKAEHIPMGILGDTISYNASAFKTREGASVEDLLRQLPGIEVDRNGGIKAQGEEVKKVLVDGKEFFGNDPAIATKNLEAEAVDKVEVFDKQSEIAEFTGIEDGDDEKTINLKLKEDYKSGGFGNVALAGGSSSTYNGKLNYNRFNTTMQASVIASANNINEQAFSFNDYITFMGGLQNILTASGSNGGTFTLGHGSMMGGNGNQGITNNFSGGLNFNYAISDKLNLTSNYFHLNKNLDLEQFSQSNNFSTDREFNSIETLQSDNTDKTHL